MGWVYKNKERRIQVNLVILKGSNSIKFDINIVFQDTSFLILVFEISLGRAVFF